MSWTLGVALVVAVVAGGRSLWSPCGLSMLTAITPFAERSRGHRYEITATWFVLGALVGGAGLGLLSAAGAAIVALVQPPAVAVQLLAVAAALLGTAADLRIGGFHLPLHPRQVDETWLGKYRRWVYAVGFGVQIGSGFATYIMTSAVYLTAVLAALAGHPGAAALVGLVFGAVRGLAVLVGAFASTPVRLRTVLARVEALASCSRTAATGIQIWAAVALAGVLAGSAIPAGLAAGAWLAVVGTRTLHTWKAAVPGRTVVGMTHASPSPETRTKVPGARLGS